MERVRTCVMCGNIFVGRPNKKYCSAECRNKGAAEYNRKRSEERQKPKVESKKRKSKLGSLSIEQINRRARAEGLTYGQYMAKYYWS